ncbi:MAG: hypothetical protein ACK6DC_23830, partial [Planctomycetota bacterium]
MNALLASVFWNDVDVGDPSAMAIYAKSGAGTWQFSTDNAANWIPININLSTSSAIFLPTNTLLRYVPDVAVTETASIQFVAWDQTTGIASNSSVGFLGLGGVIPGGGTSAFSIQSATAQMTILPANRAPVLDNSGDMKLTDILENDVNNPGDTVASIIASAGGDRITDADLTDPEGIAITTTSNGNGRWEYKVNSGTWTPIGAVSTTQALLLKDSDRVRFVPNTQSASASVLFRAWDQSNGVAGNKIDVSINGGMSPFSVATETASIAIKSARNSPPQFTSTPVQDVYVGSLYRYESTATDPDGDSLTYSMGSVVWPVGFTPSPDQLINFQYINQGVDQRGVYTWNAPAILAGQSVRFDEIVSDGTHSPLHRTIELFVHGEKGNSAPVITSQPSKNFQLPLDVGGVSNPDPVTPDFLSLQLSDGQEIKVNVSIDPNQLGTPTADVVIVIDIT